MRTRKPGASGKKSRWQLPQGVRAALEHIVLLASVGACLSLVYLLFVVLSGALAYNIIGGSALEQVTRSVGLAKTIFLWSLWVVVIAAMIRHYRTESVAYLTMLVGGACWAIVPLVVRSKVPGTSARELMVLGQSLVSSFQASGGALVVLGFLRVAVGRITVLASPTYAAKLAGLSGTASEIAAERALERPSLMRQCWELHFCRGSLRARCPRFLEGVSCWKRKSGCYCDQNLASQLLSSMGADTRVQVAEEMEAARGRSRGQRSGSRSTASKAPCGQCPIYLEHQKHKYRVLSWLSYPAAAAIIGLTVGHIVAGYEWVEFKLGSVLAGFQVLPHPLSDRPLQDISWVSAQGAAVLLIGVLLVGILLRVIEVAVFRFKL